MIQEHTYRDASGVERKQTDWGGTVVKGAGGAEGIAVGGSIIFMAAVGALVAGGFALLWFAIAGYEKFHSSTFGRLVALGLAIAYGVIVYITFASGHPDLMIILFSNIAIAIFFIAAYLGKRKVTKLNDTVKTREEKLQSVNSQSEKIICSADGIILTEDKFIVEDKTYLVSDIISAKMEKPTSLIIEQVICVILVLIMSIMAGDMILDTMQTNRMIMIGIAIPFPILMIGLTIASFMKNKRVLMLDLKSTGVKNVLQDDNKEAISGFTNSINKLVKNNNN